MKREHIKPGVRWDVLERDGHTCVYCGRKPPEIELVIDHILPVVEGGTNHIWNLVAACKECNAGKSAKIKYFARVVRPLSLWNKVILVVLLIPWVYLDVLIVMKNAFGAPLPEDHWKYMAGIGFLLYTWAIFHLGYSRGTK
jgi:hypothetical protein